MSDEAKLRQELSTAWRLYELQKEYTSKLEQQLAAKDAEIARLRAAFTKWSNTEARHKNDVELCVAFKELK